MRMADLRPMITLDTLVEGLARSVTTHWPAGFIAHRLPRFRTPVSEIPEKEKRKGEKGKWKRKAPAIVGTTRQSGLRKYRKDQSDRP